METRIKVKKEPDPKLVVTSFKEGLEIWNHPDVLGFYNEKAMKWTPQNDTAVFLPCAAHKPYFHSQSHSQGYLKALVPYFDQIDINVISEPMGVVPYCYADTYPIDSYEYNPYDFFIGKLRARSGDHGLIKA